MKTLKKIVIVLVAIIALVGIIGFFLPSKMKVERTMVIKAPTEVLVNQIADFNNWGKWSPWDKLDPNLKKEFYGEPSKVGHGYKWESNNSEVGKGSQTITAITNDSITTDLIFEGMGGSLSYFRFAPAEGGISVTWGFTSECGMNIFMRYMGLMMDRMMGKVFEQGLADLQKACDAAPANSAPVYETIEVTVPAMMYVSIKDSCKIEEVGPKLSELYVQILKYVGEKEVTMNGPLFAIYHKYDKEKGFTVLEASVPVDKKIAGKRNIMMTELKEQKAAKLDYYGDYKNAMPAWDAITKWMMDNKKEMKNSPREVYVNGPLIEIEKDTAKWHTEIYWPTGN